MVVAVSTSGTKVTIGGAAADGAALHEKLRINHAAGKIESEGFRVEDVVVTGIGFIDIPPGKSVVTVQIDMADGTPARTYFVELTR